MDAEQLIAVIDKHLVELMGTIAIPVISILVTMFLAAVSAAWILVRHLITGPIQNLTVKFEELSVQIVKVESVHGERMLSMEKHQSDLNQKHFALDSRVQNIERQISRYKGEKNGRAARN